MEDRKDLEVYKASAGSGKTFTLAVKYIALLINRPDTYRHTIAVTFTNKATNEMKERILSQLYGIAYNLYSSRKYMNKMQEAFPNLTTEQISLQARTALDLILHDYGHFRIQTIDSFFQSVLRSLAKELDLKGDVEFTLNGEELLDEAVDTFIRGLEESSPETRQLIEYIDSNLDNDKNWKVVKTIKNFAKNLLKEEFQEKGEGFCEDIEGKNSKSLKEFYAQVTTLKKDCETNIDEKIKSIGHRFFDIAKGCTVNDFTGKSKGPWSYFEKLKNFTSIKEADFPEMSDTIAGYIKEKEKISPTHPELNDAIAQLLIEMDTLKMNELRKLNSCNMSLEMYHQLGLLTSIAKALKKENEIENRFLLAETTLFLSKLIVDGTSFIFEKIGTEIDHIFIDEFQDTSKLQWKCFKILLDETLSRGNYNLIVGDVKQSIYRWRNSDWDIMNNIENLYPKTIKISAQEVKENGITYKSTNYRSYKRIVEFNNYFYRFAVDSITQTFKERLGTSLEKLTRAYSDVEQAIPEKTKNANKGYVEIRQIEKRNPRGTMKEEAVEQLMNTLHELIEIHQVAPGEIAILLRNSLPIQSIVESFKKEFPTLKIVSNEAYMLSASMAVQLIIAAMRYIATPQDDINIVNLISIYHKAILGRECEITKLIEKEERAKFLPENYLDRLPLLKGLPVYELIEKLMSILDVSKIKGDEAYIFSFLDHVSAYINNKITDINSFLDIWDKELFQETIQATNSDSVTIMTIHKSKGLEFGTVIIPFCNWELTGRSKNTLWCEPKEKPFDKISLLPINSKKLMLNSIYEGDYNKDYLYQIVDNLNLLYVGTTRAKKNLIIFTEAIKKNKKTDIQAGNLSSLINTQLVRLTSLDNAVYDEESKVYRYGSPVATIQNKESEEAEENPFISNAEESIKQTFEYYENNLTYKQSRELTRFLASDSKERQNYDSAARGELMHSVLARLSTGKELQRQLKKMFIEGLISSEKEMYYIKSILEKALAQPYAQEWFSGKYRLFNECAILCKSYKEGRSNYRPDRVMIHDNKVIVVDYKFARTSNKHKEQVKEYMDILKMAGYSDIEGYVWYVEKSLIEKV